MKPWMVPWLRIPSGQSAIISLRSAARRAPLARRRQGRDEADFDAPVVSLSLGDDALFRIGTLERDGPTTSIKLKSGDVLVFGGPARLAFHGIDRIYPGSSTLLREGGRINMTLRRVTYPAA